VVPVALRPHERLGLLVVVAAGALAALVTVVAAAAWPVVLAAVTLVALVAVVVGTAVRRPADRAGWAALAVVLGAWVASSAPGLLDGRGGAPALVAAAAGQGVGVVLLLRALLTGRPTARRRRGAGGVVDLAILLVVAALVAAHLVVAMQDGGRLTGAGAMTTAALDVLLLALLLRFAVSRAGLTPASAVLALGAGLALVHHLVGVVAAPAGGAGAGLQAVAAAAVALLGGAALLPSMGTALRPRGHRRAASLQLLGLAPLVAVSPVLWSVQERADRAGDGLPTGAYVLVGALIALLGVVRGVLALRASERAADHDPLTDLRNRRGLEAAFDLRAASPDGLLLCLVDLDDFKQVNDTYGHEVGDELLRGVAAALLRAAGPEAVVARLGGDEFVVLLPGGHEQGRPDEAVTDAPVRRHAGTPARLLAALQEPLRAAGHELRTRASVGVVHVVAPTTLHQAMTRADIAMYRAKAAGKDGVVDYRPRMRAEVQRRQRLAEDLRLLLEGASPARVGQLVVHHQPLVQLSTGQVVGSEALVRWHHPYLGLLPPLDFLDIAHEHALEPAMDALVLDTALRQVGRWLADGLAAVPVSVNVTPASLLGGGLDARVRRALAEHAVPAALLRLEITEHEQVPASPEVVSVLEVLEAVGVRVSLDDFGAGYTSLGYLQRFPVSLLKLDRSLVVAAREDAGELLAGIAAMAAALRLDVLAEGVETVEQRDHLVGLGIRYGQGHLFAPALAVADMEALLPRAGAPGPPAQRSGPGAADRAGAVR